MEVLEHETPNVIIRFCINDMCQLLSLIGWKNLRIIRYLNSSWKFSGVRHAWSHLFVAFFIVVTYQKEVFFIKWYLVSNMDLWYLSGEWKNNTKPPSCNVGLATWVLAFRKFLSRTLSSITRVINIKPKCLLSGFSWFPSTFFTIYLFNSTHSPHINLSWSFFSCNKIILILFHFNFITNNLICNLIFSCVAIHPS